ncbi:translation initiation factor IF-2 N-terminal domain-containing protein, partial [Desulfovibrio sp. 1188_IL3213]|uniref:translation initiation factor IF-2 N-terminal domain-containing protein n=2 Tax=unclassified Desulfovibrio TaxID=2593640 RepID=UPI002FD89D84
MSEEKIKVSELAKEFPAVPNKDMLRALRELGASAKSMAGSLTTEEAARVREHFAEQKQADAERSGSHPNVIVRRRRKDADKADAPEMTEAAPAAREEAAP